MEQWSGLETCTLRSGIWGKGVSASTCPNCLEMQVLLLKETGLFPSPAEVLLHLGLTNLAGESTTLQTAAALQVHNTIWQVCKSVV